MRQYFAAARSKAVAAAEQGKMIVEPVVAEISPAVAQVADEHKIAVVAVAVAVVAIVAAYIALDAGGIVAHSADSFFFGCFGGRAQSPP